MTDNDIIIESIIASLDLDVEIDLEAVNRILENDGRIDYRTIKENDKEVKIPLSLVYVNSDDIALRLFYTGKLVSTKATTVEDATDSINDFCTLLSENNFI